MSNMEGATVWPEAPRHQGVKASRRACSIHGTFHRRHACKGSSKTSKTWFSITFTTYKYSVLTYDC